MKTKWGILAGFAAIALAVAIGCDTSGGSSATDGPGTTNKPVIVQIDFSVPDCSAATPAFYNGAVFGAAAGYLYIAPNCANTNDSTYVWIRVVTDLSPSAIDHFVWTIKNWSGAAPNGIFDNFDESLDTNGVFKVKTLRDQIRYISTSATDLAALTQLYNEQIDVTVVARDGQIASGLISLKLHNGMATGDSLVFGSLSSADNLSEARPGNYADYFTITGAGSTNVLSLEGDFDTFLVLYDANLNGVATNDDIIPGFNLNSEISVFLTNGASYVVEATSLSNSVTGSYSITNSTSVLTPTNNPFAIAGQCDPIGGDYTVTETMVIDLVFNGQSYRFTNTTFSSTTIVQDGCDFSYRLNDPTGVIPPALLMGRVDFTSLELYSEALIPQCPEIFISASSISGTGRSFATGLEIDSAGSLQGTFLNVPFSVNFTSRAQFAK